jgi:hypothetical protein
MLRLERAHNLNIVIGLPYSSPAPPKLHTQPAAIYGLVSTSSLRLYTKSDRINSGKHSGIFYHVQRRLLLYG